MHENTINKFKDIFRKFENLPKDKEVKIWEIGTNFLLHIKRFGRLLDKIYNDFGINYKEIDYINLIPTKKNKKGNQDRFVIEIECSLFNGDLKKTYLSFSGQEFVNINKDDVDKMIAWSTMRQMLEVWSSMGFISPQFKFQKEETFDILDFENKILNDTQALELLKSKIELSWDTLSYKSNSIRDIAFTIVFTAYFLENNKLKKEELYKSLDNKKINFRSNGNSERNFNSFIESWNSPRSSLKKQTWNNNISKEMFKEIEEMFEFIHNKAIIDWNVALMSFENSQLLYYTKNNRSGQSTYRILMANSHKRHYAEDGCERHDIINGVKSLKLVEAAHILDHRFCDDEQIYDPENGLLIDPTLHKWFDKDLITFDEDGNMYLSKKHKDEIKRVLKNDLEYRIRENILTDKTKEYIKNRNKIHSINLDDFEMFK